MHILKIMALVLAGVVGTSAHYPCPSGEKCFQGCTFTCPPRSNLIVESKLCDWGYSVAATPICREGDRFDTQMNQCTGIFMNYTLIKAPCITRNGHPHEVIQQDGKDYCIYKYPPIQYSCPGKYFYINSVCKMMTPATCVIPPTEEVAPPSGVASPPRPSQGIYPSMSQLPKPRPLTTSQTVAPPPRAEAPRNLYEKAAAVTPSPSTYPTTPPSPPVERSPILTGGRFFMLTIIVIVVVITLKVREMRREIALKRGAARQGLYSPRGVAESAFRFSDRESRTRLHHGAV